MTGLFMLAFPFALNTDTQKPHTHVFTSHMVFIVHPGGDYIGALACALPTAINPLFFRCVISWDYYY
jgi:hypothetical protein